MKTITSILLSLGLILGSASIVVLAQDSSKESTEKKNKAKTKRNKAEATSTEKKGKGIKGKNRKQGKKTDTPPA